MRGSPLKVRRSARLVIIDPDDRILLFRTESAPMDPAQAIPGYWYVPGGGVEPGESVEDAARRELWEETGIRGVELGPCVWIREEVLHFIGIGEALVRESFFPVRVETNDVNFDNMVDFEATVLSTHRWWTVDELHRTTDVVFPPNLARHLDPLIRQELPGSPIRIH